MKRTFVLLATATLALSAWAKLPAPSDEAKAKATEAAAKAAHGGKVAGYLLCKSQNKVVAHYAKTTAATKKDAKAPPAAATCTDPGAYVAGAVPAAPAPAAVAAAPAVAPKKP